MSAKQTFVSRITGKRLHGIFFLMIQQFNYCHVLKAQLFSAQVKNSQKNIFKESYFKKWLFKNVMSQTQFPRLISSRS